MRMPSSEQRRGRERLRTSRSNHEEPSHGAGAAFSDGVRYLHAQTPGNLAQRTPNPGCSPRFGSDTVTTACCRSGQSPATKSSTAPSGTIDDSRYKRGRSSTVHKRSEVVNERPLSDRRADSPRIRPSDGRDRERDRSRRRVGVEPPRMLTSVDFPPLEGEQHQELAGNTSRSRP
jgi:hypothetical protein